MNSRRARSPRRPAMLGPTALDTFARGADPAALAEAAHHTAAVIVQAGRESLDPGVAARLLTIVDEHGLDLLAELWADRPARSLPGVLWRLYLIREWAQRNGLDLARFFAAGRNLAEVNAAIAGVAEPPGPAQVRQLADEVLTGLYRGDLDVALERAAAFCRVIASGQVAHRSDEPTRPEEPQLLRAAGLLDLAADLDAAARLWRMGELS
ncbi:MAG: hypothetical protein ACRC0L_01450 [Angustibacter sp.]